LNGCNKIKLVWRKDR